MSDRTSPAPPSGSVAARPRIVIPARFTDSASALRSRGVVAARALVSAVFAAGGDPIVVLPSAPGGAVSVEEVAQRLAYADGVLLPGGGDLAGHWSGQPEHPELYDVDEEQDAFDLAVARWALDTGLPVLAICRGAQVVNVALGGTLVQDMAERGGPIGNHRHHVHHVTTAAGSLARAVVGESVDVSCYHHQCIEEVAPGLVATAYAEEGVIEAVELPGRTPWFFGTQWHPEDTWEQVPAQRAIFEAFVAACATAGGGARA